MKGERRSVSGRRVRGGCRFVGARGRAVQGSAKHDGHENGDHARDDPGVAVHEALVFGVRSGLRHRASSHTSLRPPIQPCTSADAPPHEESTGPDPRANRILSTERGARPGRPLTRTAQPRRALASM